VHQYGARPEFVVLGGLVPEMLCAGSAWRHAGTTDVDVQVDLEVACGAVNTARLETALCNAEFKPDTERVWRWVADDSAIKVVKFERLADLDNEPNEATVHFDPAQDLPAPLAGHAGGHHDGPGHDLTQSVVADMDVGGVEEHVGELDVAEGAVPERVDAGVEALTDP